MSAARPTLNPSDASVIKAPPPCAESPANQSPGKDSLNLQAWAWSGRAYSPGTYGGLTGYPLAQANRSAGTATLFAQRLYFVLPLMMALGLYAVSVGMWFPEPGAAK